MKLSPLVATLVFAGVALPLPTIAGSYPDDVPALGYSPGNMDTTIDPREDFYHYAAGNWLKRTEIPASEPDVGGFSRLAENLDKQLLTLIKDAASASDAAKGSPRQQVGDYYKAAMDGARRDAIGVKPLEADLKAIATMSGSAQEYAVLSARMQIGYAASPLINVVSMPDALDSSTHVLVLVPGLQGLEQDEYVASAHQQLRGTYRKYLATLLENTGWTASDAETAARRMVQLESELAAARLTPLQSRDPAKTYNMMSLDDAQGLVPALNLRALLNTLGVDAPAKVQVLDIDGLKAVQKLLAELAPDELKALLSGFLIASRASELGSPWRDLEAEFSRKRQGLSSSPERERVVTRQIGAQLFHPLSQMYVHAYFPESTRREITEMVQHVKDEFGERLRRNAWLDEPTRAAALEKLAKMDIQVGYPQAWIDFSALDIRPDDHFGNVQRANDFMFRRDMAQIGKKVLNDRFAVPTKTTPIAVNAAYNFTTNTIDITAAIVQPPFYKAGADAAVNYCSIGAVIGHEITHGFDSLGRQYGPMGNLRDWWTSHANSEFKLRTDVLVEQYDHYEILPGLMHDGALTLTENTADLGGISLAHAALRRHLADKPQQQIDGLNPDQRCFVSWAQMWAYKARSERLRFLVANDVHAIASVRATAPLLHLDAFHEAFATREGDAMWRAPEKRMEIW